jgi:hypothetical protein
MLSVALAAGQEMAALVELAATLEVRLVAMVEMPDAKKGLTIENAAVTTEDLPPLVNHR